MPGGLRFPEVYFFYLASRARVDPKLSGHLYVKDGDTSMKWRKRWVVLYQNFLFYFENSTCAKPLGLVFLEHSAIDVLSLTKLKDLQDQHTIYVAVPEDTEQHKLFLRAGTEDECNLWLEALRQTSYASLQLAKKEMEERYSLCSHILEAEQAAKLQLTVQCEEYEQRIESLENHLASMNREAKPVSEEQKEEGEDIKKIKKIQSLVRAWLCRRRWHSVVQNYIESGHASSIRQRNQLIFRFFQDEEEYVKDMSTLVTSFLRPFRMAASAKKPPTSHEEVNSIFLNCEIILFLHQIFLKGLYTRMEYWPTLVLGDLFRVLLPMYGIYQEYVRNHHYSLQTLAECKQSPSFNRLLRIHEEKPVCGNRSLETFLTLPMHRVPRYIITLHRLLAVTPPDHVDRPSLEHAQNVLEDLSLLMHDEVSETENIRKNLSIERQIVGGCEELLDVQQVFIRQGSLIQVLESNKKLKSFGGLGIKPHERKEYVVQCFLFSGLLLIATRSSNGKLHLHKATGKLHLSEVSLIESTYEEDVLDASGTNWKTQHNIGYEEMALRVVVHPRDGETPLTITLVAQSAHEKAAWMSDLKQCIENVTLIDNVDSHFPFPSRNCFTNVRSDSKLYLDDVGIKYSKYLNSCRVPRIRYATLERLFERLLDLRFLSIEFLNTFLITYRIFTDAETVLNVLETFYRDRQRSSSLPITNGDVHRLQSGRRTVSMNENRSAKTYLSGRNGFFNEEDAEEGEEPLPRPTTLQIPSSCYHRRHSSPSALGEGNAFQYPPPFNDSTGRVTPDPEPHEVEPCTDSDTFFPNNVRGCRHRTNSSPMKRLGTVVSQTWVDNTTPNHPHHSGEEAQMTSSNDSRCQLTSKHGSNHPADTIPVITTECSSNVITNDKMPPSDDEKPIVVDDHSSSQRRTASSLHCGFSLGLERSTEVVSPGRRPNSCPKHVGKCQADCVQSSLKMHQENPSPKRSKARAQSLIERRKSRKDTKLGLPTTTELKPKCKLSFPRPLSPRLSTSSSSKTVASPGAVVTSSRASKRRTNIMAAAAAFAAATAGAACSPSSPLSPSHARFSFYDRC